MVELVSKNLLFDAKAYVCWDVFSHLSVQLIPLETAVAFYYPPKNPNHTIVVFYLQSATDFAEPLFLLFHECGHVKQWQEFQQRNNTAQFYSNLNSPNLQEKQQLEIQAWQYAETLLRDFLRQQNMERAAILQRFNSYKNRCQSSYAER